MRRLIPLAAALLLALHPAAGRAQGDSLVIRDFHADVVVRADGVVEVTETLRIAFFGPWNGILRDLSLEHRTAEGRRQKLRATFQPPTDERGQTLRHELERPDGWTRRLRVWVPGAHDAERTLVIRYRVDNALRFFEEGSEVGALDELYWNVTGNRWTMPIERVTARVSLPDGVDPAQAAAYTGYEGSDAREADVRLGAREVTVERWRRLEAGEGLTVGVGWAPGVIPRPTAAQRAAAEWGPRWPLALPLLAFVLSLRIWRRRGRDPEALAIVVQYEPPHAMSPAELGTLVDHSVDMRELTATIVDLAVRGYISIEERQEKKLLGLLTDTEYVFHLRRARSEWDGLELYERRLLSGLFSSAARSESAREVIRAMMEETRRARAAGERPDRTAVMDRIDDSSALAESVELSQLRNRFYTCIPGIKDAVYDALMRRGYYVHRPDKVKGHWVVVSILLLMGGIGGGLALVEVSPSWIDGVALAIGAVVSAVITFSFGMVMPARTHSGARARENALGFREFLDQVESDRFRRMITSPEMFERYLPHAMAFGVEERWARAFDDLLTQPPDWYSGPAGGFRASAFSSRLHTMSSQAGSTMSSSPSSSGSGGGGSSGGGSGGGGGSGF